MNDVKRVGATEDPLWLVAFPVYYLFMLAYGVFATIFYLPSIRNAVGGETPAFAQLFGVLITIACLFGLIGSLRTTLLGKRKAETVGHLGVIVLMVLYFLILCYLVVIHDPTTRPGAMFVPMVFAVFPAVRLAVIVRDPRNNGAAGA